MNVSLQYLENCSAETGFQVAVLEKVTRLGDLAGDVGRHPLLGRVLALKGGTALNLGFGPPTRLSVDLDYNYIGAADRADMLADRPRVEEAAKELALRKGYRVQQSAEAFAGRKIYLHYRSALGPEDRIELDLNYLFRVPLAGIESRVLWQPGKLDRPTVRTVGIDELLAGKLLALLDRCTARDAWDVANLDSTLISRIETKAFRSRFIAIAGILNHPLFRYGRDRLETQITQRNVDEQLLPMLVGGTLARSDALVAQAWARVQPLLQLEPDEHRYLSDLDRGQLNVNLLFPEDPDSIERFSQHPALLWKIRNVQAHLSAQGTQIEETENDKDS